jgi:hypothetical protein
MRAALSMPSRTGDCRDGLAGSMQHLLCSVGALVLAKAQPTEFHINVAARTSAVCFACSLFNPFLIAKTQIQSPRKNLTNIVVDVNS